MDSNTVFLAGLARKSCDFFDNGLTAFFHFSHLCRFLQFLFGNLHRTVIGADDFQQVTAGDGIPRCRIDDVVEPRMSLFFGAHRTQELKRVFDIPSRGRIHPNVFFVLGRDLFRVAVPSQQPAFHFFSLLDIGDFYPQPGTGGYRNPLAFIFLTKPLRQRLRMAVFNGI